MLITLIGGRIVPSFTRNWLARQNPGRLPAPFGRFDSRRHRGKRRRARGLDRCPDAPATGAALLVAGSLQAAARALGRRPHGARALVLILHVGYAFVPLGFLLTGAAALDLVPAAAGIHAWTGGAIGTMTLAVMTRASLGHTGRMLSASFATQAIYAAVLAAALVRIAAALAPAASCRCCMRRPRSGPSRLSDSAPSMDRSC